MYLFRFFAANLGYLCLCEKAHINCSVQYV